ncbi:MAG: hypothetical protein AB2556_25365 [Candidatus Thiodiazotropha sp.]
MAQRVVEHFERALRGQGLRPTRRRQILEWKERVHESGATVADVVQLEHILKRAIILRDIAGEHIYNSGKYQSRGADFELICHNGHAWPKDLHFPQSREVHIYEGDVWQAIQEATHGEPLAVWLLGGQDRQLSVDQFVLQDGRPYRTQEAHEKLPSDLCQTGQLRAHRLGLRREPRREHHGEGKERLEANLSRLLLNIQKACVEHGHGGLWNSMHYDTREVISIDMRACYPTSFQGMGEAKPYFKQFGHPTHGMTRVAINGPLPTDIGTGFAEVVEWEFSATCHPVIPAWFGRHFPDAA